MDFRYKNTLEPTCDYGARTVLGAPGSVINYINTGSFYSKTPKHEQKPDKFIRSSNSLKKPIKIATIALSLVAAASLILNGKKLNPKALLNKFKISDKTKADIANKISDLKSKIHLPKTSVSDIKDKFLNLFKKKI